MVITGSYHDALVTLSVLIAIAASYTALDLAGRVRVSAGWVRHAWLATAAGAMGGGVWAMHFVGMLAFEMPEMEVSYDLGLTLLSLAVPVLVTGLSFFAISRFQISATLLLAGGTFMGVGIAAMHYIGMAAMQMPASLRYDRLWVFLSILIAIVAASVALWLSVRANRLQVRVISAVAMGIAVSGMHYAGMHAAIFRALDDPAMAPARGTVSQVNLALAVAVSTFAILSLSLIAATFDRRFAFLAEREAAALRQSEERFRLLYRRTPLPLYSLNQDGWIEDVTDAWLELLGYPHAQVIGRPFINFLTEASARQAVQVDWPTLMEQGELTEVEYNVVTKDGRFLDVLASVSIEYDAEGHFVRALGGLANITDRKRAEEALRQLQKMEAVGQVTGGVAHDFNNLLSVIIGNIELLRRRVPDDPKLTRLLDGAMQGAQRGASLTQRLLTFARRQRLEPEPVDLPELVRGVADLLQRSLGPTVRIETQFPLTLSRAHVDANQLELVLLNLAVNARDAMPDGGRLTISANEESFGRSPRSGPNELPPGDYVCLSVADTGTGMDPATLARATEPFFTTKGVGKGTGLGLSTAQGLAEQSGGRLVLRSKPGGGTTVELWLPAIDSAAPPQTGDLPAAKPVAARSAVPLTVLAVDDDPLVLANTVAMLEDLGHTVLPNSSAQAALRALADGVRPDIVVTDHAMPGVTGLQLAERVRTEYPSVPVLLVSGYAEVMAGADFDVPRLNKPFTQVGLAEAVDATLRRGSAVVALHPHRIGRRPSSTR
ncbi:MAG: MHYT domain-containing protein [Acetobacteraceae bacterium]|nr:MHYT domain-containing protein [Acetobacteraceae bacterium]